MADILVFPNISFDETDVGAREISPAAGNRIGVVGRFLKGPRNKFQIIDRQALATKYGRTKDNGSIAIQTASDQGANDFGVVRVMGSGINAGAYLEFNLPDGQPAVASKEKITLLGTAFKIPFLGSGVTQAAVVAQNFASGIRSRFAGFEATVDGDVVTISTSIPEALDLPIKFLVMQRANQNNEEVDTGITAKYAEVASQFAQGGGTEIFTSPNNKAASLSFRLSNGSIAIKFAVAPAIGGVANSNKSAFIHVLLGADVETEANVTTIQTIIEKLSKSVLDRRLGFTTEQLVSSPRQLFLRTRIEDQAEGNSCKFLLVRESLVAGVSPDANLTFKSKTAEYTSTFAAYPSSSVGSFGGAVAGPAPGVLTVRRNKFIRAAIVASVDNEMSGTPAAATDKDKITFTGGEVTLGTDEKIVLASISVPNILVSQGADAAIILEKQNGVFTLVSKSVNDPVGFGIKLGVYKKPAAAGNAEKGTFEPELPINGDVLRIVAASEGSWSKNVTVSVVPGADNLITVNLRYKDVFAENNLEEKHDIYLDQVGVLDESSPYPMVVVTRESSIAQIFYVGDNEENKKAVIQGISELVPAALSGSSDGPDPSTADWLEAIRVMGQNPVNILIASGSTLPQVRNALIRQAEESDETSGLRIAVLSADRRLSPHAAGTLTQYMDSKHAVMVGGHVTYNGRDDLMPLSVPPDGFYAGHLAVTPIHVSPAGRTSSPAFKNITAVDIPSPGTLAYNEYTKARIEMIIPDQISSSFHCLNGRSLSKDPAWAWISLRRTYNYIRSNAFSILQFAKSEPNSAQLRSRVSSSISNFMYLMRAAGQIESVVKIQADDENNTPKQVAAGILRVDIYFVPVYPADFIKVGIHRRVIPIALEGQTAV